MHIDFHFHTCISKSIAFHHEHFLQSIDTARHMHIDALMMTDHFDNHDYQDILATLQQHYSCPNGDYFDIQGIRIYPGMEVETREGSHILLNGTVDTVYALYQRIKPHTAEDTYLPTADVVTLAKEMELLCIYAHPFRPAREIEHIAPHLIPMFDALDINGKDLWRFGAPHQYVVTDFAKAHALPAVAGSDAHHHLQIGVVYNELLDACTSVQEIRRCIRAGRFTVHVHPQLHEHVEAAQIAKKAWKRQHRLQNDDSHER